MKKTYLTPGLTVVQLQHQGLLMQSARNVTTNLTGNDAINMGGASSNNTGGIVRTKESSNIWDEEW